MQMIAQREQIMRPQNQQSFQPQNFNLKRTIAHFLFFVYALLSNGAKTFRRKLKMMLFYQYRPLVTFFADPKILPSDRPKVLVNIAHIVAEEEANHPQRAVAKVERLQKTIDGLFSSFSHCELTIVVSSLVGRNVVHRLPDYQRQRIHLQLEPNYDPLFIGFRVQEQLIENADRFDWFIFVEDDILIHDSCFLDKLIAFSKHSTVQDVLMPNRYELLEGTKRYIDLTIDSELAWNRLSKIEVNGVKFAECSNPHSGMYCLSKAQIQFWKRSGRLFHNQNIMVSPLESAATFCLLECFNLYKPHPQNLHYLEVQHYDTKYSKLYPAIDSPYTLIPMQKPVQRSVQISARSS
jgi:hypothetical protein